MKIHLADDLAADARVWMVPPYSGGQRGIFTTDVAILALGLDTCSVELGGAGGRFTPTTAAPHRRPRRRRALSPRCSRWIGG